MPSALAYASLIFLFLYENKIRVRKKKRGGTLPTLILLIKTPKFTATHGKESWVRLCF